MIEWSKICIPHIEHYLYHYTCGTTICVFYLRKISAPNGNQQFIEYQNQKLIVTSCISQLFKNIGPTTDVDALLVDGELPEFMEGEVITHHQHI